MLSRVSRLLSCSRALTRASSVAGLRLGAAVAAIDKPLQPVAAAFSTEAKAASSSPSPFDAFSQTFPTPAGTVPTNLSKSAVGSGGVYFEPNTSVQKTMAFTDRNEPRFVFRFPPKEPYVLNAILREGTGKILAQDIREEGYIPCAVVNPNDTSKTILFAAEAVELERLYREQAPHSIEVHLNIKGFLEPIRCVAKNWTRDLLANKTTHVQFMELDPTRESVVRVPVFLTGREDCIGIKKGGLLLQPSPHLDFTYNPVIARQMGYSRVPRYLLVDIVDLNIGQTVHAYHVPLPPFLKLHGTNKRKVLSTFTKRTG